MFYILIATISIFTCYKYGDWRNWKNYYTTMLFFVISSIVCTILTYNHTLWLYQTAVINNTFTDLFIAITVYPCTVMIFVYHLPSKNSGIILYISIYAAVYTIGEFVAVRLGYFTYHNRWNIRCSLIFNCIMFPVLILHYKKPIYAWIIALLSPHILFFLMKIPYSSIK